MAYNSDYLTGYKTYPRVTAIRVNQAEHKVYVRLQADASSRFPVILSGVVVRGDGEAQTRMKSRLSLLDATSQTSQYFERSCLDAVP